MTLERDEILDALGDLAHRLSEAGIAAGIRVVGGAALSIEYFDRPATADIDGLLHPSEEIKPFADQIASERGWPEDWLNDKVTAYVSHRDTDADWKTVITDGEVTVKVGSPKLLLAMKLWAGRGRRDGPDIEKLLAMCDVNCVEDAEHIFDHYYPEEAMKPGARKWLEGWLAKRHPG
jgi:hypothetical protein